MNCSWTGDFADGTYTFRLDIGGQNEVALKTGRGPQELADRLRNRIWWTVELREIIRLGFIGGGMAPVEALRLVRTYVDERPLFESLPVAIKILEAALFVPKGEEPKKAKGRGKEKAPSDSLTSMPLVQ